MALLVNIEVPRLSEGFVAEVAYVGFFMCMLSDVDLEDALAREAVRAAVEGACKVLGSLVEAPHMVVQVAVS